MINKLHTLTVLLLTAGLAIGPFLSMNAQASNNLITFNTTSAFDSGTKTGVSTITDTCENVTSNNIQSNNTGNYQGIGLTTNSNTCPTGAWGVSPTGLVLSYDMQTLRAGKMKDFSGNGNDGTVVGPVASSAKFGMGMRYPLNGTYIQASAAVTQRNTTFSAFGWVKPNHPTQRNPLYYTTPNYGSMLTLESQTITFWGNVNAVNCQKGASYSVGTEYPIGAAYNDANGTVMLYFNGAFVGSCAITPHLGTNATSEWIGEYQLTGTSFNGTIDEMQLYRRFLSSAEFKALATDGRSSFLSSGSWTSPILNSQSPTDAQFTVTNQTPTNRISRFQVLSNTGSIIFDKVIPYFQSGAFDMPINTTFNPSSWSVKLYMIGNGTGVSQVSSVVLTIGFPPTLDSTAIMIIFLLFAFTILFIVGFFERWAMLMAGIVSVIIAIETFIWTGNNFVSVIFIFMMALCIGLAITKKETATDKANW